MDMLANFIILFYLGLLVLYIVLILEAVNQAEKNQISSVLVGIVSVLCTPILGFILGFILVMSSPLNLKEEIKLAEINQILQLESKGLVYIEKQQHQEALYYFKAAMQLVTSTEVRFIKTKYYTYIDSIISQLEQETQK